MRIVIVRETPANIETERNEKADASEAQTNPREVIGHASSKTTEVYTHITTKGMEKIKSPLDKLGIYVYLLGLLRAVPKIQKIH